MLSTNLSNIAILNIKGSDYCCIISLISKNEAIKLLQNADLSGESGTSQNIKNLFSYITSTAAVDPRYLKVEVAD